MENWFYVKSDGQSLPGALRWERVGGQSQLKERRGGEWVVSDARTGPRMGSRSELSVSRSLFFNFVWHKNFMSTVLKGK